MFIGIIGTTSSGKTTLSNYLIEKYDFKFISLIETNENINKSDDSHLIFNNFDLLLTHVTNNWQTRYVTDSIVDVGQLRQLRKRPFFLLVNITAPLSMRYQRYQQVNLSSNLEQFLSLEDNLMITTNSQLPLATLFTNSDLNIINSYKSIELFFEYLDSINLVDPNLLRPCWDGYFISLSELASKRSNCMKRRVGCIIVKDNRVLATGYNGTPRNLLNCSKGGCPRCNSNSKMGDRLDLCLCIHAEENALLEAGRERISEGFPTLYCTTCPCLGCAKKIVQVGIKEVVYCQDYGMDNLTLELFSKAGIKVRKFVPYGIQLFISD